MADPDNIARAGASVAFVASCISIAVHFFELPLARAKAKRDEQCRQLDQVIAICEKLKDDVAQYFSSDVNSGQDAYLNSIITNSFNDLAARSMEFDVAYEDKLELSFRQPLIAAQLATTSKDFGSKASLAEATSGAIIIAMANQRDESVAAIQSIISKAQTQRSDLAQPFIKKLASKLVT